MNLVARTSMALYTRCNHMPTNCHYYRLLLTTLAIIASTSFLYAQGSFTGIVVDAATKQVLPFATIKFGGTGQGTISNLNGKFDLKNAGKAKYLEVSYLGYEPKKISLPLQENEITVYLDLAQGSLKEVVIKPPYDKMRRILNTAIANRDKNNPDKYDWYRCHVYYKMAADVSLPDSVLQRDTSADVKEIKAMIESQHLLMSETYSVRTWKKPQHLQEEVSGSRFSGFKKSMFTGMVTDMLPFHSYNDYLRLNGKDYHNPVSRGFFSHYDFNLEDEILQGDDTLWILSFRPQKGYDELRGRVYINSDGYAIAYLLANVYDKQLKRSIRMEQQYKKTGGKWFPHELNYILSYQLKSDSDVYTIIMKGNSNIDSVSYDEDKKFRFDKVHTVKLEPDADGLSDAKWNAMRPIPLDNKEQRTYVYMDSLVTAANIDKYLHLISKLPEGKVPVGPVDLSLSRLYSYNKYEKTRLGLGLQTNEKIVKWLSLGGWFGYGFGDKEWKYGGFAEIYADRYKEFVFRFAYSNDLRDPGRVSLNRELDRNYLKMYLMTRVDNIVSYSGTVKKRFGYWTAELEAKQEQITPKYSYFFNSGNSNYSQFTAKEASLNLRYAYAERSAPAFGTYYKTGTKYPIWYGKITTGMLDHGRQQTRYTQAVTAVQWHKHVNRVGFEHFLIEAGKSWSDKPLPLSKLFAGNGFRYGKTAALYAFGGLLTMYPYDYYSDQFVTFVWRHDFDWHLYKLQIANSSLGSNPYISLGYNMLYGSMAHPEAHRDVAFLVPDDVYNETGITLNNIIRLKYLNLYYITLNIGYYYHWTPTIDLSNNGRIVFGLGIDL